MDPQHHMVMCSTFLGSMTVGGHCQAQAIPIDFEDYLASRRQTTTTTNLVDGNASIRYLNHSTNHETF